MDDEGLGGRDLVARWGFVYDYPDDPPGGFVAGQLVLGRDGVLLRRYDGTTVWQQVTWWPGEDDPRRAAGLLRRRGYQLREL
ncbi:hypothetical protein [Spirillospora sp. CA-294931]|uniref:hypothetical protein n=1 Tax=Spirillospora sp. CA-294931 TaxID=3240042 RepID=UPI003D8C5B73